MNSILIIAAALLYLLATALLVKRLASGIDAKATTRVAALLCAVLALLLHTKILYGGLFVPQGINLSFFLALSLTSCLAVSLILITTVRQPIETLGIAAFPFAALSVLLQGHQQDGGVIISSAPAGLETHILISAVSYSLLALAAIQAVLLAIQNKHLRNRHPGGFIRALPPLETMENLLFRLIGIGYILLSISLLSAIPYTQDVVAQHLIHKTTLSVAAWVVFAILLWGRWRFGWRGRIAIRWTLSGFVVLMLAYFGSKLVRELILGA